MIAMFDSGLGGLSVWRELVRQLPDESVLYFADHAFCPYGERSHQEILLRCESIAHYLERQGAKLMLIACNTATSAAARYLRERLAMPVVGIEPALKPAAQLSQSRRVGVLATRATLSGEKFSELATRFGDGVVIYPRCGEGWVELVEAGQLSGPEAEAAVRNVIEPLLEKEVDQIVLGCTHYPFLLPLIEQVVDGRAQIIDPAQAVCRQVARQIEQHQLACVNGSPHHRFVTTGDGEGMRRLLQAVLGIETEVETIGQAELEHHE
jgi:glutamate racemase